MKDRKGFYVFLMLLTSFLWGGNFVVSKSLVSHASPLTLTSLRWLIAIVLLLPMVWRTERRILPPRKAILPLVLMGITGVVLFNIFQFLALERTASNNVALISTLIPIAIAVCSFIFLKERMNALQVSSMILSLFGVLLVLSNGNISLIFSLQFNAGDLWMIGAISVWGLYSILSRWAMKETSSLMATLYSGVFGLLILLPFNVFDFAISSIDQSFIVSILYTGVVSTVICMVLWNSCTQKLGATAAGVFLNFNPIFTVILSFLFLGEQLSIIQSIGGCLVIAGCIAFHHFQSKTPFVSIAAVEAK
ncbi:DMT family transporter [Bacillus badius]|uniref:Permease of the drug/metabolite transporter (DMT) superfamily n=1 Tax=Bacillus badius TaxID=1455 RepID=A0ABR5AZE0_BACBA|nr:DMT family transporter [Bacillus badius]KIL80081.1 Permease of the drug/metabolite transporter (DMT) superfamily [Bacillus badius]KZR60096.1 transporter [Bacillus badius]MED4717892.1 DMT family transporter [Bacillus badius]